MTLPNAKLSVSSVIASLALTTELFSLAAEDAPPQLVVPINFAVLHGPHGASSFDCLPKLFHVPTGHNIPSQPNDNTSKSLSPSVVHALVDSGYFVLL